MIRNKLITVLSFCLVGCSLFARDITIEQGRAKAFVSLYTTMEKFEATDQLSADFMTVYTGIKNGKTKFSQRVYRSAFANAVSVAHPSNMIRTVSKKAATKKEQAAVQEKETTVLRASALKAFKGCCGDCIEINQEDLPRTIDQPGKYSLAEDLTFSPEENGLQAAITIDASDVRLDLCGHKLQQGNNQGGNLSERVIGIEIKEDHKNIDIRNGTICNFMGAAIHALIDDDDLDTVCFTDLTIIDNGDGNDESSGSVADDVLATGINLFPEGAGAFRNITIRRCKINGNTRVGIFIVNACNLLIEDTQCNDTFVKEASSESFCLGCALTSCKDVRIKRSSFNRTRYEDTVPTFTATGGVSFTACENIQVTDCQCNDTSAEASLVVSGAIVVQLENAQFKCCQFNNTIGEASTNVVAGFVSDFVADSRRSQNMKLVDCQSNNITRSADGGSPNDDIIVAGMLLAEKNIEVERCQAVGIRSENELAHHYGFVVVESLLGQEVDSSERNVRFKKCTASDISGIAPNKDVLGFGVYSRQDFTNGPTKLLNVLFENCVAERIRGTQDTARIAGISELLFPDEDEMIYFNKLININIKGCTVSDVQGGICNNTAGILLESVKNAIVCDNCVNDCVAGILLTGTDRLRPPKAFQLAETRCDALAKMPVPIDLENATATGNQTFKNLTRSNEVNVTPNANMEIIESINTIPSVEDLNNLNWQPGDEIQYLINANDPVISPLVDGEKFFLIVYSPGFTECGLFQNNKVTNCSEAGFKDINCPTQNAFVCNTAVKNGDCHETNYCIKWEDEDPVCKGDVTCYPECKKPFNISVIEKKMKKDW